MVTLLQVLEDILQHGKLTLTDASGIVIHRNEDGDVQITYRSLARDPEIRKIRERLDAMDAELVDAASEVLRRNYPTCYSALASIDDPQSVEGVKEAFSQFMTCAKAFVGARVSSLRQELEGINAEISKLESFLEA